MIKYKSKHMLIKLKNKTINIFTLTVNITNLQFIYF